MDNSYLTIYIYIAVCAEAVVHIFFPVLFGFETYTKRKKNRLLAFNQQTGGHKLLHMKQGALEFNIQTSRATFAFSCTSRKEVKITLNE